MSPTKPRPAITRRIAPSSSTTVSSIPRCVKPFSSKLQKPVSTFSASCSVTTDPKKKKILSKESSKESAKNVSIFSDSTAVLASASINPYFSKGAQANKENMPMTNYNASYSRANNGGSPIRQRSGVSKPNFQKPSLTTTLKKKSKVVGRIPLRELNDREVFLRDEAVLGDLRRRRSGEHSGTIVEVESTLAVPSPGTSNAIRGGYIPSSTDTSALTAPTEEGDEGAQPKETRVLRRSDSEEALRAKIDAIIASTSAGNKTSKKNVASKSARQRSSHPAIRQGSPGFSPYRSDVSNFTSPAKSYANSPLRIHRSPSPIVKFSPSPIRSLPRRGLGTKAINTILSEKKLVATVEGKDGEKAKKVIINTSSATGNALKKKTIVTKKAGSSSLRRAAGAVATATTARDPSRPPLALAGGRVTGLEGMRKMR